MRKTLLVFLPFGVFLVLAAISWNRWIEPYVDTGRELEVPWRLAHGQRLYRDVAFFHGPLAPWLAEASDSLFGRSLPARVALAAAIALAHLEALRRLASRMLAPARASVVCAVIVAACFFLWPGGALFPFSFDTSLAVAAIAWALLLAGGRPAGEGDAAAGACVLAALLCRPEMGIAAILVLAWETRVSRRLIALAAVPASLAAVAYTLLSLGTPLQTLRREGWLAILGPPAAFRSVYSVYAGFDRPALRLAEVALAAVLLALVGALVVSVAFFARGAETRKRGAGTLVEAAALAFLAGAAAVVLHPPAAFADTLGLLPPLVRVVPPIAVAAAAVSALRRLSGRGRPSLAGASDALLFTAALFGLRLLLAAGYVGPYNAFLLPLPTLVAASLLFSAADRARSAAGPSLTRLVGGALVLFLLARMAALAAMYRAPGWSRVDTPAGALYLMEPVASATRLALADLNSRVPSGGSIVGFPEAGFFNYVLDRPSPLREVQFFPGHLDAASEEAAVRTLQLRPPDAVLLCNVLASSHGSRAFGTDYLQRLDGFLRARFATAASFGPGAGPDARVGNPQFFLTILVPPPPARP